VERDPPIAKQWSGFLPEVSRFLYCPPSGRNSTASNGSVPSRVRTRTTADRWEGNGRRFQKLSAPHVMRFVATLYEYPEIEYHQISSNHEIIFKSSNRAYIIHDICVYNMLPAPMCPFNIVVVSLCRYDPGRRKEMDGGE